MGQYIHFYGNVVYCEKEDGDIIQFSSEQFQILKLISKKLSNSQIIAILLKDEEISEANKMIINDNIDAFRKTCTCNKINIDNWTETGIQGKYYPKALTIEMTNKCNFYCSHCYKEAGGKNKQFLPADILKSIYSDFAGKISTLNLTGGEPLLYTDISNHIEHMGEKFLVNVTTNGTLITLLSEQALSSVNNFQISLYGYDEASYEQFTGAKGQFHRVMESMRLLTKRNQPFTVAICLNKTVCRCIERYIKILEEFAVSNITFTVIGKIGRGKRTAEWDVDEEDIKHLVSFMSNNTTLRSNCAYLKKQNKTFQNYGSNLCSAGSSELAVSEKGELLYCNVLDHDYFKIGDFDRIYEIVETGTASLDFKKRIERYIACHDCKNHICPLLEELANE